MHHRGILPSRRGVFVLGCLVLGGPPIVGCSSDRIPTYPAQGQVVFPDGEPVRTGVLELKSLEHGVNAQGQIARDGSFTLGTYTADDGAVAGEHQAIVVQFLATDSIDAEIEHDHGDPVDRRFADYATSGLEVAIESRIADRVAEQCGLFR